MPEDNLVWMDLEMTGLNPEVDRIIEIATIVTDSHLNILAEGPVLAIKQSDELLGQMDEWCTSHHTASGLVARVQESSVTEAAAMEETIKFAAQYVKPGKTPLCGNSIWQDRRFLMRYMTDLNNFFHYRNIDVSTIKELASRWNPELYKAYNKESAHLALEDIRDSIDELKYYKDAGFVGGK